MKFARYEARPVRRPESPAMRFDVREARAEDLRHVARLMACRDGGGEGDHLERLHRHHAGGDDRRHIVVAEVRGMIAGFGRSHLFVPPPDAPRNVVPPGWQLAGLIVDAGHRRRGIGLALTRARLVHIAERADVAYYFANAQNRPTIDLHSKLGFAEVTRDFWFPGVSFSGEGVGILFRADLRDTR